MGDGTTIGGVQTPKQRGVIVREEENLPIIPERLLKLTPVELQKRIGYVARLHRLNASSILPDSQLEEELEDTQAVLEFAKTAVERQGRTVERG